MFAGEELKHSRQTGKGIPKKTGNILITYKCDIEPVQVSVRGYSGWALSVYELYMYGNTC